jgi:hypothetical protein
LATNDRNQHKSHPPSGQYKPMPDPNNYFKTSSAKGVSSK